MPSNRSQISAMLLSLFVVSVGCADDPSPSPSPTLAPEATPTQTPTPTAAPTPTRAPLPSIAVKGVVPSDGAMAVPRFPGLQVALTQPLPAGAQGAVRGTLVAGETQIPLFVDTDAEVDGDSFVSFLPTVPLQLDTDYSLVVEVDAIEGFEPEGGWPLRWTSKFSTRVPCGVAFNIAKDIQIEALGGNDDLVAVLQNVLDKTGLAPISLLFVDVFATQTFPVSQVQLVAGLPRKSDGLYVPDPVFGFPVSVEGCEIDASGAMTCLETTFVFPIPITDTTVIYLTISHASLVGRAVQSGSFFDLDAFTLEGVITEEDLVLALDAAGLGSVSDYIILDVDTNGDGVNDAASALASSDPSWLDFADCDEAGVGTPVPDALLP